MKTLHILFCFAFIFPCLAQEGGIRFYHGSLDDAKALAKEKNKLIFMDVYTTWCGPCKRLDRNVFSVAEVGDYFNENFVNVKVDAEQGEGIAIARQYRVGAYPTLLFLDHEGEIQHAMRGFRPYEPFLDEAKTVVDPDHVPEIAHKYATDQAYRKELEADRKARVHFMNILRKNKRLDSLHKAYVGGDRSVNLIADYLIERAMAGVSDTAIFKEYKIQEINENSSQDLHVTAQSLFLESLLDNEFDRLSTYLSNQDNMSAKHRSLVVSQFYKAYEQSFEKVIADKDSVSFTTLIQHKRTVLKLDRFDDSYIDQDLIKTKLDFYQQTSNAPAYHALAQMVCKNTTTDDLDSMQIQDHTLQLSKLFMGYENLDLPASEFEKVLKQSESNLALFKHPTNYAPVLLINQKLGRTNEAMNAMREGMVYGKKNNLETEQLFKLFTRIKKM